LCESVKLLRGTKLEDPADMLVVWIEPVNAKSGTETEVIKAQVKVL
jgi:hypothetical protein